MIKIKGCYVATVIMDFEYDDNPSNIRPFDEIRSLIVGGDLTKAIRGAISEEIFYEEVGRLQVEQQYADLYKVEES